MSTFSDENSVRTMAKMVLDERLCACVNFTTVRSLYSWKGKQEDQEEILALFKTTRRSVEKLKKMIMANHPYDVPEIIELTPSDVSGSYLSWLIAVTSSNRVAQNRHNSAKRGNSQANIGR
jgi:periplasmic divalent cation tolerance protein